MPGDPQAPASAEEPDLLGARYLAAQAVAREAGELACRFLAQRSELSVELKGPQDFVSEADRAVERLIIERLSAAFPDDSFLGEEGQARLPIRAGSTLWVIDPIDGTANFLNGRSDWCVSIGAISLGEPAIGVIYHPAGDELYAACKNRGAFLNSQPIHVSRRATLAEATVAIEYSPQHGLAEHLALLESVLSCGGEYRRNGSAALSLAQVAAGRIDAYTETHIYGWDVLAGMVLVAEAGGWITDYFQSGELWQPHAIAAAGPMLRKELLRLCHPVRS